MEGVLDFDPAAQALRPVRVDSWGPFVFACLDGAAPPLADLLGAIPSETARLPLDRMGFHRRHDWVIGCNWKVYVDNYLEGYHIPVAHPGCSARSTTRATGSRRSAGTRSRWRR